MIFQVLVEVGAIGSGISKLVLITPYYTLHNLGDYDIDVKETTSNTWITVPKKQLIPFYPKHGMIQLKVTGTEEETASFNYDKIANKLLPLNNKVKLYYTLLYLT